MAQRDNLSGMLTPQTRDLALRSLLILNAFVSRPYCKHPHSLKSTPFFKMKFVILISVFLSLGSEVAYGFPSTQHVTSHLSSELRRAVRRASEKRLLFDPLTTPIEGKSHLTIFENSPDRTAVTGEHSFIAPDFDAGDQRGPCPGLNALANHGYIGRNGVTSVSPTTTMNLTWHDKAFSWRRQQPQSTKSGEWGSI